MNPDSSSGIQQHSRRPRYVLAPDQNSPRAGLPAQDQFEAFRAAPRSHRGYLPDRRGQAGSLPALPENLAARQAGARQHDAPAEGAAHCAGGTGTGAVLDHWYIVLPCSFIVGRAPAAAARPPAPPSTRWHGRSRSRVDDDGVLTLFVPRDLFPGAELDTLLDAPLERGSGSPAGRLSACREPAATALAQSKLTSVVEATRCLIAACASRRAISWRRRGPRSS